MGLIDHNHVWTSTLKVKEAPLTLDEVHRNHSEGIGFENGDGVREIAFKPGRFRCRHGRCRDRELAFKFTRPLLDKMGWTQNGEAVDFTTVEHFSQDKTSFDCLTDTHIISDEETDDILTKSHHQGSKLIGSGFKVDAACCTEGACTTAQGQSQGIPEQLGSITSTRLVCQRRGLKAGISYRIRFEFRNYGLQIGF